MTDREAILTAQLEAAREAQNRITRDDHSSPCPPDHDTDPDELAVCPYAGARVCPVVARVTRKLDIIVWHTAELSKLKKPVTWAGLSGIAAVSAAILWELLRIAGK